MPVTLCIIKKWGKSIKEERKLYCSSRDVDEPNIGFLIVNELFSLGAQFWSTVVDFLFSKRLLSAVGIHQLYLHPPFPTVQVCLFH